MSAAVFGVFPYVQLGLTTVIDYQGGTSPVYVGQALPGAALSAELWQIKYITYDTNGNPLTITYAGAGSAANIWNNRTSLTYS